MTPQSFMSITGIITDISFFPKECCSQSITLQTTHGIVNFTVSSDTYIVDNMLLERGMHITAFYDPMLPVPLIYPPRYQAAFITPSSPGETVTVAYFDQNLLAADHSLQLNIGPSTSVVTANGQPFTCPPGGNLMMVYYIITTRSIPPQTTPRKVITFC